MKKYVIVDGMNMFFRAAHVVNPSAGIDNMIGMGFHIMLNSMLKAWNDYEADHVIFCLEGRSWRKDYYPEYKLNRKVERMSKTETEQENTQIMMEAFDDFCQFLTEKTNITVLRCPVAEADDMIAFWVDSHPDDHHVIVSSDSDFQQLLAKNVEIFNGVDKKHTTLYGIYDTESGGPVIDKKTGEPKVPEDPDYILFLKCIRGDKTDNIFSAFPGAREKGTKNKVGIREAYADRVNKGFAWNNFMQQRWTDHNEEEHTVKEAYERNKLLIDLRMQPDDIKLACAETITEAISAEPVQNVGIHFMRFCTRWSLNRINERATAFGKMLNAKYNV